MRPFLRNALALLLALAGTPLALYAWWCLWALLFGQAGWLGLAHFAAAGVAGGLLLWAAEWLDRPNRHAVVQATPPTPPLRPAWLLTAVLRDGTQHLVLVPAHADAHPVTDAQRAHAVVREQYPDAWHIITQYGPA